MATFKAIVFQGGRHLKKDGSTNIKIRVFHNGDVQYLPTEYYINPLHMGEDGQVNALSPSCEMLNYELTSLIQKYREICLKLGNVRTAKLTCKELKEELLKSVAPEMEYIDFVSVANQIIAKTVKRKTAAWYQSSINSFAGYLGTKKIDIKCIKSKVLEGYMEHLYKNGAEHGTVSNYLRGLRALFNKVREQYNNDDLDIIHIPNEPFSRIKVPEYTRKRKALQIKDIIKIRDSHFDRERTNMARDVFMMQFYLMGINLNDFFRIMREKGGRISYERSKVTTIDNKRRLPMSIRVEPELRPLLAQYSNGTLLSFLREKYSDYNNFLKAVNKELKVVSEELNLGVDLSTNWARHSWASIARNKAGVAKADVDFCLGHVNND